MEKSFESLLSRLHGMVSLAGKDGALKSFLEVCALKIETAAAEVIQLRDREGYVQSVSTASLKKTNSILFHELDPRHYGESFLNPARAVGQLGEETGRELGYFFFLLILSLRSVYRNRWEELIRIGELLLRLFDVSGFIDKIHIRRCLSSFLKEKRQRTYRDTFQDTYVGTNPAVKFALDNHKEKKYLFLTGYYIEERALELYEFLNAYDGSRLSEFANAVSDSFINSFRQTGKNLEYSSSVRISYYPGYEPFYAVLREAVAQRGLVPLFVPAAASCFESERWIGDHDNDFFSYFDDEMGRRDSNAFRKCCEDHLPQLQSYSGFIDFMFLREDLFPESNRNDYSALKLSRNQQELKQEINQKKVRIIKEYCPEEKTSFCYAPLAVPPLGSDFSSVFEEIMALSVEDDAEVTRLQQMLIDEIDGAEFIQLTGKEGNKTNIRFRLSPLNNASLYTNFTNTGKGQNIPAGEIFTTPLLTGTSGIVHLERFSFRGHTFKELTLGVENGFVEQYGCANFKNDAENIHFIITHLFSGYSSLPVGEFGVGTNTRAYSVMREYDLFEAAPVLLIEKTAPHFALGDSCYARRTGEIKNSVNGKTLGLLQNQERLFNTHIDLTMPFENIKILEAVFSDGKRKPIIADGVFIPEYLSQLNRYL